MRTVALLASASTGTVFGRIGTPIRSNKFTVAVSFGRRVRLTDLSLVFDSALEEFSQMLWLSSALGSGSGGGGTTMNAITFTRRGGLDSGR
jgi:hypothetical protein